MQQIFWMRLAVLALVSVLLAPPAVAQTEPPPAPATSQPPPAPPLPPGYIWTGLVWIEQPNGGDFARLYPARALRQQITGRVIIDCLVDHEGRIDCAIVSEEPVGHGFGSATLAIAPEFRVAPVTLDGTSTAGMRIRRGIRWELSE